VNRGWSTKKGWIAPLLIVLGLHQTPVALLAWPASLFFLYAVARYPKRNNFALLNQAGNCRDVGFEPGETALVGTWREPWHEGISDGTNCPGRAGCI